MIDLRARNALEPRPERTEMIRHGEAEIRDRMMAARDADTVHPALTVPCRVPQPDRIFASSFGDRDGIVASNHFRPKLRAVTCSDVAAAVALKSPRPGVRLGIASTGQK